MSFDEDAALARGLDEGDNGAFLRVAGGLLAGAGDTLLTEERLGLFDVAARLGEGALAVHHAGIGLLAKGLDCCWIDISHGSRK